MGLLIECPKCKQRNSPRTEQCKCGVLIKKLGHKAYWVEYYDDTGRRSGSASVHLKQRLNKGIERF